ncbi:MAG: hydrogenase [Oceanospirillaceae bacterium]|nr:hydrogenase [Oceanospirillaceae bacterium]
MNHPLLNQLVERHGFPCLNSENFDTFIKKAPWSVLFFTEDPNRFSESLDVAVILPELAKRFTQLSPAVIARDSERALQGRYNFNAWPTLVFLREGRYLGALSRVRNWDEYLAEIERILSLEPSRDPGIGIPVVSSTSSASPCGH